jgi:negative regulator of sigma E activity
MSDLVNEQLSALVDGELPPEETTLLMRRIAREPELARRYARYQAMGDLLRGERARPSADLSARICAAVAAEPLPESAPVAAAPQPAGRGTRRPGRRQAILRPLAGLGLAAAVGALAVVLVGRAPQGGTAEPSMPVAREIQPAAAALPPVTAVAADEASPVSATAEPASYVTPAAAPSALRPINGATLANYVAAHARMSGALGGRDALIHLVSDPAVEEMTRP